MLSVSQTLICVQYNLEERKETLATPAGDCRPSLPLPPVAAPMSDAKQAALYKGDTRARMVDLYADGVLVVTWTSSGTTDGFESIYFPGTSGTTIEIVGVLQDSEWLSILEVGRSRPTFQSTSH